MRETFDLIEECRDGFCPVDSFILAHGKITLRIIAKGYLLVPLSREKLSRGYRSIYE